MASCKAGHDIADEWRRDAWSRRLRDAPARRGARAARVPHRLTKVAVADALFGIADRCVQVMGGTGVSSDTVVQQVFREVRAFRIYDGPTEVHKWSLAKRIKREWSAGT